MQNVISGQGQARRRACLPLPICRLTNLFDGVSFVIEANPGKEEAAPAVDDTQIRHMIADAMRGFAETLAAQMGE